MSGASMASDRPHAARTVPDDGGAPLVTVVLLAGDRGGSGGRALESVRLQTHAAVEVLVVGGGSAAPLPAEGASARRVGSAAEARREARGEYVAFLDARDEWLPGMLAESLAALAAHPEAELVIGAALHRARDVGEAPGAADDRIVAAPWADGTVLPTAAVLARWLADPEALPSPSAVVGRRAGLPGTAAPDDAGPVALAAFASATGQGAALVSAPCLTRHLVRPEGERAAALAWLRGHVGGKVPASPLSAALAAAVAAEPPQAPPEAAAPAEEPPPPGPGARGLARAVARRVLPRPARAALRGALERMRRDVPEVGAVKFGDLRRVTPLDGNFGYGRGTPVDRRYVEAFLAEHAGDVRGRTLEIGDASYTLRYGGSRVTRPDVLHVHRENPHATIVADLEHWHDAPEDAFDCVVLTQTLHLLYDMPGALATLHRVLAPGGVLLCTAPGLAPIDRYVWRDRWYWALTEHSMRRLLADTFGPGQSTIRAYGNVLTASAFLYGLAAEELTEAEYAVHDAAYAVVVAARAVKGAPTSTRA